MQKGKLNFLSPLIFTCSKSRGEHSVWGRINAPQGTGPTDLASGREGGYILCCKSSHLALIWPSPSLLPKMTRVYCTDLCLQSSWSAKQLREEKNHGYVCISKQILGVAGEGGQGCDHSDLAKPLVTPAAALGVGRAPSCYQPTLNSHSAQPSPCSHTPPHPFHSIPTTPVTPTTLWPPLLPLLGAEWEKATLLREPVTFSDCPGWLLQEQLLRCGAFSSAAWD